jgi:biopolymer transport protein ExbB
VDLTQKLLGMTLFGAEWVLWLLLALSVLSVAIMMERVFAFRRAGSASGAAALAEELRGLLGRGDVGGARKRLEAEPHVAAAIGVRGFEHAERGADAAAEAMTGARARELLRLERNLAILGTLGNNAPFIGLFGTVLGIIKAFHDLSMNQAGGAQVVMKGISEALVATAVGLLVAIPAVMAFNYFQRRGKGLMTAADELAHVVLAHLRGKV